MRPTTRAAALLRVAHEEFASNPSWRAPPEMTFAQRPDATRPVLAALRVDFALRSRDEERLGSLVESRIQARRLQLAGETARDPGQ